MYVYVYMDVHVVPVDFIALTMFFFWVFDCKEQGIYHPKSFPCVIHSEIPKLHIDIPKISQDQFESQDPKIKAWYHLKPYFRGISPFTALT